MRVPNPDVPATITLASPAFLDGQAIPRAHTCRGAGLSPELSWEAVPVGSVSLALVMSDPDAPRGPYLHWLVFDITPGDGGVASGAMPTGARLGENSARRLGWFPPCPPSGTHRYVFTVYALDARVGGPDSQDLLDDIADHAIATGTLTGLVTAG